MRQYKEEIDRAIIDILYKNGEMTFGTLADRLKQCINAFSYETYSGRLKQLCEISKDNNNKQSRRYVIQPVLQKRDDGRRGSRTYYSLTKDARIRCDLKLPILKSESQIEKAYRILFRYLAFEIFLPYRKLKDENDYNSFLKKLSINKNELQLVDGKSSYNSRNLYKVTKLIHQQSRIKLIHTEYLEKSENYGKSEYYYQLPGISINEFIANKESGLAYGHLDFNNDGVMEYFKLLEDKELIEKIKSRYLIILNEEDDRYSFVDHKKDTSMLKEFLQKCWLLHGSVTLYLYQKWKSIQRPTEEEKIWYEHLWGKERTNQIFTYCNKERVKLKNKSKNQKDKQDKEDVQKLLNQIIISVQRRYEAIKNTYSDIIDDYAYLANPLLNLAYPQFLRQKE